MIDAKVIADSINGSGDRLTTFLVTFNRYILAELNTHRMLSRNAASSRAIPVSKMLSAAIHDPAMPVHWGRTQKGMQAARELDGWRRWLAVRIWLLARWPAVLLVWALSKVGLHKQVANRILEPWLHSQVVVSATEWDNFFKLRDHEAAQPEFRVLARLMRAARAASEPRRLADGALHLPFVRDEELIKFSEDELSCMSVARCARVSYVRSMEVKDLEEDRALVKRLSTDGHWSPFEHVAIAATGAGYNGNFKGWTQLRKAFPNESGRKE